MSDDRIFIRDLLVRGIVGINDWERRERQDILVSVSLFGDFRRAGESDRIEDCVNYRSVAKAIIAHIESSQRYTVEALATDLARQICEMPGVTRLIIRLEKPGALRFAESVGIELERTPDDF